MLYSRMSHAQIIQICKDAYARLEDQRLNQNPFEVIRHEQLVSRLEREKIIPKVTRKKLVTKAQGRTTEYHMKIVL